MQKYVNVAFSLQDDKIKKHKCNYSIDFDGLISVDLDNLCENQYQMMEIDNFFISNDFDKNYIAKEYKKQKFDYLVFSIDAKKHKVKLMDLQDFAFLLFSGLIFENFDL